MLPDLDSIQFVSFLREEINLYYIFFPTINISHFCYHSLQGEEAERDATTSLGINVISLLTVSVFHVLHKFDLKKERG